MSYFVHVFPGLFDCPAVDHDLVVGTGVDEVVEVGEEVVEGPSRHFE